MSGTSQLVKKVAVFMGSDSDFPIVKKALHVLESFGVPYEAHVYSAHRTPDKVRKFAAEAEQKGFGVIIAAAGKAAALPGAVAAYTTLPVIGLPIPASQLDGLDALLSMVQMPPNIPVATVAIGGAENAALLACQILSLGDPILAEKMKEHRANHIIKAEQREEAFQATLREEMGH